MNAFIKKLPLPLVALLCLLTSCARFVPPTGGDKDIEPPKLLSSLPKDKSLNYRGTLIELIFDEYVDTKTLKQDLIITPEPDNRYKVRNKGKIVEIEFEEPLADSTTYTFNFERGIKDLNEQNNARNLKLVFSTGNELDSLSVSGKLTDLFSKKDLLNATVALYNMKKVDSLPVLRRKPSYFVKSDSTGNFLIENIKAGSYKVIAYTDKNSNQRFDNKKEQFGYLADTINLTKNISGLDLALYPYDSAAPKYKRFVQRENFYSLRFDENLYKINVKFENKSDSLAYNFVNDEIRFYRTREVKDSVLVNIIVQDSLLNTDSLQRKIIFREPQEVTKRNVKIEPLVVNVEPSSRTALLPKEEIIFKFDFPLQRIDTTKFRMMDDTIRKIAYRTYFRDSSRTTLGISILENVTSKIALDISKGGFVDINGDSSNSIKLEYPVLKINETGVIAGRVGDQVQNNPLIIQLVNEVNGKVEREVRIETNAFTFDFVKPGNYFIRAIEDKNNNGIWDSGSFSKNTKPENIYLTKEPVRLKANFELKNNIVPMK